MPFTATALPREKAKQPDPQVWLFCNHDNFSDEFAQSNAEGI